MGNCCAPAETNPKEELVVETDIAEISTTLAQKGEAVDVYTRTESVRSKAEKVEKRLSKKESLTPTPAPERSPDDPLGAYLIYEPHYFGTMYCTWSREQIPGALAFARPAPKAKIPPHKLAGDKIEMARKVTAGTKSVYTAWCNFVKSAKNSNLDLKLLESDVYETILPVTLVFHERDTNKLTFMTKGQDFFSLAPFDAVIAIENPVKFKNLPEETITLTEFMLEGNNVTNGDIVKFGTKFGAKASESGTTSLRT